MSNKSPDTRDVFIIPERKGCAISLVEPDDYDNITDDDRMLHDMFAKALGERFERLEEKDE